MKALLLACLAVAATAPSAYAAPGRCVAVTDPRGDVSSLVPVVGPERVDLVAARVVASSRGLNATLTLDGAPDAAAYEVFGYAVEFDDGENHYRLAADKTRGAPYEFVLQVRGDDERAQTWSSSPASGSVDVAKRTVTLNAAAGLLGPVRQGKRFTVTDIAAWHGYVSPSSPVDHAGSGSMPLVAGDGRCRR